MVNLTETFTAAEKMVERLNAYSGENIWQEVILHYEDEMTEETIDGDGETLHFLDGSMAMHRQDWKEWVAYPADDWRSNPDA